MRDATRENYGPWVYPLISLQTLSIPCCHLFYFAIYFIQVSSTHFICLQITSPRGLTTLLPVLGASVCFFVCSRWRWGLHATPIGSITLVPIEENTHLYYTACPLLLEEIPTQLTSSRKNFWRRWRGDIINISQVPTHKLSSPCIYFIFLFHLPFYLPLFFISLHFSKNKNKNLLVYWYMWYAFAFSVKRNGWCSTL